MKTDRKPLPREGGDKESPKQRVAKGRRDVAGAVDGFLSRQPLRVGCPVGLWWRSATAQAEVLHAQNVRMSGRKYPSAQEMVREWNR